MAPSEGAVLLDFWGSHCMPCRAVAPVVDKIEEDHRNELKVVRYNIEDDGDVAMTAAEQFGVQALPTLILLVGGQEKGRAVGNTAGSEITELVNSNL